MSMQSVFSFGQAVAGDEQMQSELKSALGGATGQEAYAKTAEFASSKGYDVSATDVEQGYAALEKSQNGGELNEAELEMVSGGKGSGASAGKAVNDWDRKTTGQINDGFKQVGDFFKNAFKGY